MATSGTVLQGGADTLCVQWTPASSYTSQYSSASLCMPITVNAASTSISWSPSTATIIASAGPTAAQFDATALAGDTNVTANGAMTYHLSTAGGTVITIGATLPLGANTICAVWAPSSSYALDYNGSSTCQSFTVINTQPTTTTLAANTNPVFSTNSVTLTATVTPTSGSIVPTGTVTFFDGSTADRHRNPERFRLWHLRHRQADHNQPGHRLAGDHRQLPRRHQQSVFLQHPGLTEVVEDFSVAANYADDQHRRTWLGGQLHFHGEPGFAGHYLPGSHHVNGCGPAQGRHGNLLAHVHRIGRGLHHTSL